MAEEIGVLADEQAADLAALQSMAGDDPLTVGAPDVPAPDPVAETAAAFGVVVAVLSPLLPYVGAIYTDDRIKALAGAYVPVAEKYGWESGGGFFDKWGAEIALLAVAGPMAAQTVAAHRAWMAERAKERGEAGQGDAPTVGQVVTDVPAANDAGRDATGSPKTVVMGGVSVG